MRDILIKGALELGVELSTLQVERFFVYMEELKKWNKKINLTSIDDEHEIIIRHFLDSLSLSRFVHSGEKLLDMGSGAGFPGLALKIANPALDVTLLDKVEKKAVFMRHIIRTLELEGIDVLSARADDKGVLEEIAASFDVVVSRAFSALEDFLSLAIPYIKRGGRIIAVKGPNSQALTEEVEAALIRENFSGLALEGVEEIEIPLSDRRGTAIIFIAEA